MNKHKFNRKRCLKFFTLAVGVQIIGALVLGLLVTIFPSVNFLFLAGFYFYTPAIFLVWTVGGFRGEGALIWPMVLGIPLGILFYAFIFARVCAYLSSRRSRRAPD